MPYQTFTKVEVAERQLFHSIQLYIEGEHLMSAITLAGAAEEILGTLVKRKNRANAIEEKVKKLCDLFERVFKQRANPADFCRLRNNARNQLKHVTDAEAADIELNLEEETVNIVDRAIKNHQKLTSRRCALFRDFQKERVRRYRLSTRDARKTGTHVPTIAGT